MQQWSDKWYCLMLTVPFIPLVHFLGLNDTGILFTIEWYCSFPDAGPGGKCNKEFWSKWAPRRFEAHALRQLPLDLRLASRHLAP